MKIQVKVTPFTSFSYLLAVGTWTYIFESGLYSVSGIPQGLENYI